jgi:transcriptional regulator with XRE-family HTH domain
VNYLTIEKQMSININEDFTFISTADTAKTLAKRVQAVRKKKFKTQMEFAKHLGLTYSKVSRFEKSGYIQFTDLLMILKALNLIDELQELFVKKDEIIKW